MIELAGFTCTHQPCIRIPLPHHCRRAKIAHAYRRRATAPKTAARPAPAPVAALMAPALKAGWEAAGVETAVPVAPAVEGTRGVEVAEETGVVGRGVEEELEGMLDLR